MKTFSYTFAAGETMHFPSGKFFIVITAGDALNVDYFRNVQKLDESAQGVTSGYYAEFDEGFDSIQIYSATIQTIKIAISKGSSGGFNISSTIITDILGGVIDEVKPYTLSTFFDVYLGTALQTIVTPAANTAGIRIDNITMGAWGATGFARVMHKTSAPVSPSDGYALAVGYTNSYVDKINTPIIIPSGHGLYAQANVANAAYVTVAYEAL